jgi:hypothetical protein
LEEIIIYVNKREDFDGEKRRVDVQHVWKPVLSATELPLMPNSYSYRFLLSFPVLKFYGFTFAYWICRFSKHSMFLC